MNGSPSTPHDWQFAAESEQQTEQLGSALADALVPGTVVALIGDLGAGKTRLVQAVAAAMGVDRRAVSSPTFVLLQEYDARLPVYHFDAYRLRDVDEFLDLGADELMAAAGVCLIEWADRIAEALLDDVLWIEIDATGPTSRRFRLRGTGPRSSSIVSGVRAALA